MDDIFTAFKGNAELARAIGVTTEHAGVMKRRGSIPVAYWSRLLSAAEAKDIKGLDPLVLVKVHATTRASRSSRITTSPSSAHEKLGA
ncbi:MAG TPA: hypothetical protein VGU45_01520 [Microvirga sp.]|nr:hypothetical protein [Microvirga sp.]